MGTEATATVQARIDAQQDYDAIEYGIRSIKVSRNAFGASATHSAQIIAGCQAATRATGAFVAQDYGTLRALRAAKKAAGEHLLAARDAEKAIGSRRQIMLALAA